jgi:dienelactone hydrolase
MRTFEFMVIVANLPYLSWLCFSEAPPPLALRLTPILTILLWVCHLVFEDRRWHMIPAYLTVLLVPLVAERLGPGLLRILFALGIVGLLSLSAAACSVFPVFDFPALSGPFPVGTTSMRLVDENRPEPTVPSAKRELMIQIWYPAEKLKGFKYARYRDPAQTTRSTRHLALVKTRSILEAPVFRGQARFPILLFSPSIFGNRNHNTYQVEQLASHGFVVVGIDHTHCVALVVFPDGRRVRGPGQFLDFSSEQAYRDTNAHVEADLLIRVADAQFVLDKLVEWNSSDPSSRFTGRLDIRRAGILGHSFGGAVAAEACRRDSRFVAGLNIDGWMFGKSRLAGVEQPYFFMSDDTPMPGAADLSSPDPAKRRYFTRVKEGFDEIYRSLNRYGGYFLSARGLTHMKYSDFGLFSPLQRYSVTGALKSRRAHKIINHYTLAFFNKYLYGKSGSIQELSPRDYPEVKFESHLPII